MPSISTIISNLKSEIRSANIWKAGVIFLVMATLLSFSSITIADPDLWGHLRFGLDILESGSIPREDMYSYLTTDQNWINHEWLAEVLFALAWVIGNSSGLIILKTIIISLTFGFVYWRLIKKHHDPIRIGIILIIVMLMLWSFILPVRPQIFTIFFFGIFLIIIINAENGNYRLLWASPLILAIWANLHGGFLAGLGVLLLWTLMHLPFHKKDWQKFLPPVILACIATLFNPYGPELLSFLARTATVPRLDINDWRPISIRSFPGVIYLSLFTLSILGLVFSKRKRRPILVIIYLVIATLPLLAYRHIQLFSMAVLLLTGEHIINAGDQIGLPRKSNLNSKLWFALFPFIAGFFIIIGLLPRNLSQITVPSIIHPFPFQAKELLKHADIDGNLAIFFNWGEYIIWHLGPEVKVSMDGRRETIYPQDIYQEYLNFHYGKDDWDAILNQHDTGMALVSKSTSTYNLMLLEPNWELIFEDNFSALFAQRHSSISKKLKQALVDFVPSPEPSSFP